MAPTMPTACSSSGRPQPGHEGRSRPRRSASWAGLATTYCGETPGQAEPWVTGRSHHPPAPWPLGGVAKGRCPPPLAQALQGAGRNGFGGRGEGSVAALAFLASHLVAEGQGHNSNKESKKGFQLPQP